MKMLFPTIDMVPSKPSLMRGYLSCTNTLFTSGFYGQIPTNIIKPITLEVTQTNDISNLFIVYSQQGIIEHLQDIVLLVEFDPFTSLNYDERSFTHKITILRKLTMPMSLINELINEIPKNLQQPVSQYRAINLSHYLKHLNDEELKKKILTRFFRNLHRERR